MLDGPALVAGVVVLRRCLLEDVPCTPGNDVVLAAFDVAVPAPVWWRKSVGDGAAETGFLGDEQTHGRSSFRGERGPAVRVAVSGVRAAVAGPRLLRIR